MIPDDPSQTAKTPAPQALPGLGAARGAEPVGGTPPVAAHLTPGQRIGRFRVDGFVAQGGMGEVYRGYDDHLLRRVALKTIRSDWEGKHEALARFHREAQILAKLNHPTICQIFDLIEHQGSMVLAMEWVEGRSLAETMEAGPLPRERAISIARAIARALVAAHGKGIVHRDLKPSNVMVLPDGGVKVLDFGLAVSQGEESGTEALTESLPVQLPKRPETGASTEVTAPMPLLEDRYQLSETGTVMGTFSYMAPEVFSGNRATAASDMFSFGVVLHELFAGCRPFPGKGMVLMRNVLDGHRNPMGRRTPKALRQLLGALLQKEPGLRPSAQQVGDALDRFQRPLASGWWAAGATAVTLLAATVGLWAYSRGALREFTTVRKARVVVAPIFHSPGAPDLGPLALSTTDLLEHGLQRIPKLQVVRDHELGKARPRLEVQGEESERAFLAGVVLRTGADLVLLGEVVALPGSSAFGLQLRLLDRRGSVRASLSSAAGLATFQPHLAVPNLLTQLSHKLAPLSGPPDLPGIPSEEALEAYGLGLEAWQKEETRTAMAKLELAALEAPRFIPGVLNFGWCLKAASDPRALATFQWARAIAREAGDRGSQAQALIGLALVDRQFGKVAAEERQLTEARSLAEACKDVDLEARALNELAVLNINRKEFEEAKPRLDRAMLLTAGGDRKLRPGLLINYANIAKYRGERKEAARLYLEAYQEAGLTNQKARQITAQSNLATFDLDDGRPAQAERSLEVVLALRKELLDRDGEARTLINLGIAAYMQGDLVRAAARFEASRSLASELKLLQQEGRALFRLGDVLRTQGRFEAAQVRFEQALLILQKNGKGTPENVAETLAALAECAARRANLVGAERRLQQARAVAGDLPQIWRAQAWVARARGEDAEARRCLAKALEDPTPNDPEHQTEVRALMAIWNRKP